MNYEAIKFEYQYFELECKSCERLWQIGYPTLLVAGLVGNSLCLVAFAAHNLRVETRLLCSLCAALDSLALVTAFATRWPDAAFGTSILEMHPMLCLVLNIANYWLPELAAWTLVYLSIERFLSVYFSFWYWWLVRSRNICLFITCSIGLVLLLVNFYFFIYREPDTLLNQTNGQQTNLYFSNETHSLGIYNSTGVNVKKTTEFLFQTSASSSQSTTQLLINLSRATASSPNRAEVIRVKRVNEFVQYEITSERSECEAALAGSQWALWNLVDLVISSLGPFAIIFAFNLAILIRISTQCNSEKTRQGILLRNRVRVVLIRESESQCVQTLNLSNNPIKHRNKAFETREAKAEKSVTLMLLVTTFAFVLLRAPISVGHSLQTLLTEEKLFDLIEPVICMAAFSVAEMLAFGQHSMQFFIYFACSPRFRQAILRQLDNIIHQIGRLSRLALRPPDPENGNIILLTHQRQPAPKHYPLSSVRRPQSFDSCQHTFLWIEPHILMCRRCFHKRVVHHPSCPNFRDEQRLECECLDPLIEHPAHIVVHLTDCQLPH